MIPTDTDKLPISLEELGKTSYTIIDFKLHGSETVREIAYNKGVIEVRYSAEDNFESMSVPHMAIWMLYLHQELFKMTSARGGVYRSLALIRNREKDNTIGFVESSYSEDGEMPSYEDLIDNIKNLNHTLGVIKSSLL